MPEVNVQYQQKDVISNPDFPGKKVSISRLDYWRKTFFFHPVSWALSTLSVSLPEG